MSETITIPRHEHETDAQYDDRVLRIATEITRDVKRAKIADFGALKPGDVIANTPGLFYRVIEVKRGVPTVRPLFQSCSERWAFIHSVRLTKAERRGYDWYHVSPDQAFTLAVARRHVLRKFNR